MIPYLKCMLIVATTTGLPPRVLPVIQAIEGGSNGMVHRNVNGSADYGVMQINSAWVPELAKRAGLSKKRTTALLIENSCFNIAASAVILRSYLRENNGSLLAAVGDYHSHNQVLHSTYIALAEQKANELFSSN